MTPQDGGGSIIVSVRFAVDFHGGINGMLKKMISSRTKQETRDWYRKYSDFLRASEGALTKSSEEMAKPAMPAVPAPRPRDAIVLVVIFCLFVVVLILIAWVWHLSSRVAHLEVEVLAIGRYVVALQAQQKQGLLSSDKLSDPLA
mmetsp:Transcript_29590/g.60417  ORF Transcript_29590/g.60417 Transcript_29590/m.60417 type:complete len:145 (-) Transcript_29590:123-557(-)